MGFWSKLFGRGAPTGKPALVPRIAETEQPVVNVAAPRAEPDVRDLETPDGRARLFWTKVMRKRGPVPEHQRYWPKPEKFVVVSKDHQLAKHVYNPLHMPHVGLCLDLVVRERDDAGPTGAFEHGKGFYSLGDTAEEAERLVRSYAHGFWELHAPCDARCDRCDLDAKIAMADYTDDFGMSLGSLGSPDTMEPLYGNRAKDVPWDVEIIKRRGTREDDDF